MDLNEMFEVQRELQRRIFEDFDELTYDKKKELTKEFLLHGVTEVDELLSAVGGWKTYKIKRTTPKKEDIAEELIDIFKFLINTALVWDISPESFSNKFLEKNVVNKYKLVQDKKIENLKKEDKIAILDIDGVINDYPSKFVDFVNRELEKNYSEEDYLNLPNFMDYETYEKLKLKFREKGSINYFHEPVDLIKNKGIPVVLLTSRPRKNHKRTYNELIISLEKNKIKPDVVIEDKEKGSRIMKDFGNVRFVVEDEPEYIKELSRFDFEVFLIDRPYNRDFFPEDYSVRRIKSVEEVFEWI